MEKGFAACVCGYCLFCFSRTEFGVICRGGCAFVSKRMVIITISAPANGDTVSHHTPLLSLSSVTIFLPLDVQTKDCPRCVCGPVVVVVVMKLEGEVGSRGGEMGMFFIASCDVTGLRSSSSPDQ